MVIVQPVVLQSKWIDAQSFGIGANFDLARRRCPTFMKMSGTGSARQDMPPSTLAAGPTPSAPNIGFAANGSPKAIIDLKNVFAETADAAYSP